METRGKDFRGATRDGRNAVGGRRDLPVNVDDDGGVRWYLVTIHSCGLRTLPVSPYDRGRRVHAQRLLDATLEQGGPTLVRIQNLERRMRRGMV